MARQEIVTYAVTDDIDGTPLPEGHESTRFVFNGAMFDIDLSAENVEKLNEVQERIKTATEKIEAQIAALRAAHNEECAKLINPYMQAGTRVEIFQPKTKGRKASKAVPARRTGNAAAEKEQRQQIRWWAERHIEGLSDRGRIPAAITEAFENNRDTAALKAFCDAQQDLKWKAADRPVSAPPAVFAAPTPAATPEAIAEPPAATEAPAAKPAKRAKAAASA